MTKIPLFGYLYIMNKAFFLTIGYLSLALGIIGMALPVLPTTPFLILSAFCFKKGSGKVYFWLINHPTFGGPVTDWETQKVISPKNKFLACMMIFFGLGYPITMQPLALELKIFLSILGLSLMIFILTRKSHLTSQNELA